MIKDSVYPRWRGELRLNNAAANSNAGLSPLARGTLIGMIAIPGV
ncbi:hypothetical protein AD24_2899 [Escherichia coli 2-011-08_S4_C3]|nr:hypothetical protein HMPREF1620_04856 [Escherichia coli 909945-2]KDT05188.1 hypothetical protein AC66_2950 [Escherichia coli 2-011-08_S4_C1]KDT18023.1 hypothetical protein AD24_2899 [Escherichia coli 2-011-08_S4_C3]KDT82989.1 hypothetical protein AB20_3952 [Escherichia coli 3-475-03_S1_C1]CTP96371.1 hypothetical protein EC1094_2060 [Escherichia coli]